MVCTSSNRSWRKMFRIWMNYIGSLRQACHHHWPINKRTYLVCLPKHKECFFSPKTRQKILILITFVHVKIFKYKGPVLEMCRCTTPELLYVPEFHTGTYPSTCFHFPDGKSLSRFRKYTVTCELPFRELSRV